MKRYVVLLQTDLVDSTRTFASLSNGAAVKAAHDRIARDLLERWGGEELERSDGFLLGFDGVERALDYAASYHDELSRLEPPLFARAAIHRGELDFHENSAAHVRHGARGSEANGTAIAMTVRVASLACGGQTLLSKDAADVMAKRSALRSHGFWRLKGLADPIEIFEASHEGRGHGRPTDSDKAFGVVLRQDHWIPTRAVARTLPAERNVFIGRRSELDRLRNWIDTDVRLISILGMGGAGKTRLAVRFGWETLGLFDGGSWYCDLSTATTREGVLGAVAQGLDVALGSGNSLEQIAGALDGRGRCLVVLDNAEQVSGPVREAVATWLDRAPEATFVVTTRVVLGVDGEQSLPLRSLPTRDARELLLCRAQAIKGTRVELSAADESCVESLTALLDGLPLAIELAAARLRVMSLSTLMARMSQRFTLLASRDGRVARHSTLRAALDWSWTLLASREQSALAQAAVFEGGFDLDAFEAVVAADARSPMDLLQSLVEQSWIVAEDGGRFTMLKSVQDYARAYLDASDAGMDLASTWRRHATYFAAFDEIQASRGKCCELDNLVIAMRHAVRLGDGMLASQALFVTWSAVKLCGPITLAVTLVAEVRTLPNLTERDRATIAFVAGSAHRQLGDPTAALREHELALAESERHAPEIFVRTLVAMGEQRTNAGRFDEATLDLDRSSVLAETLNDDALVCLTENARGGLSQRMQAHAAANTHYLRALVIARSRQDRRWEGGLLGNLGTNCHIAGDFEQAERYYIDAIRIATELGDRRWEGNARCNLGLLSRDRGQPALAEIELKHAQSIAEHLGNVRLRTTCAWNLALTAASAGRPGDAERRYREAAMLAEASGDTSSVRQLQQELTDLLKNVNPG